MHLAVREFEKWGDESCAYIVDQNTDIEIG
jgi:hypothetical protein